MHPGNVPPLSDRIRLLWRACRHSNNDEPAESKFSPTDWHALFPGVRHICGEVLFVSVWKAWRTTHPERQLAFDEINNIDGEVRAITGKHRVIERERPTYERIVHASEPEHYELARQNAAGDFWRMKPHAIRVACQPHVLDDFNGLLDRCRKGFGGNFVFAGEHPRAGVAPEEILRINQ